MKINDKERKVLEELAEDYGPYEWRAYYFRSIVAGTKLTLPEVRRACRSLAKKGLAKYERGLFNEDGEAAGSGYRATEEGAALISPCDLCAKRAAYEYDVEEDGTQTSNDDEKTTHILECEEHYQQSFASRNGGKTHHFLNEITNKKSV